MARLKTSLLLVVMACVITPAFAQEQCNGRKILTTPKGLVMSNNELTHYEDGNVCQWEIRPADILPESLILIEFTRFEVEYWFDYLQIWETEDDVTYFTGTDLPRAWESKTVGPVFVQFITDSFNNLPGFEFTYAVVSCPASCSEHGFCNALSICDCDPGWSGTDCSTTICPSNGCNNGVCVNDTCRCDPGYYGGDCLNPFCEPNHRMTTDSGVFSDHRGQGAYLNNMACSWTIDPSNPADSILLTWNAFDLELDFDYVAVFDGTGPNALLLANFTGHTIPPPLKSHSGVMTIVMTTDMLVTGRGFSASYQTIRCDSCVNGWCVADGVCHCYPGYSDANCTTLSCTENCHQHGFCSNNICRCQEGWGGLDCGTCDRSSPVQCGVQYCSGAKALTNETGTIRDHTGNSTYGPSSNCVWNIAPIRPPDSIEVHVIYMNIDQGARLSILDASNHQVAVYSGLNSPSGFPPVVVSGNKVQTRFTSPPSIPSGDGFVATYAAAYCQYNCNDRGHCERNGVCHCELGFGGDHCEFTRCVDDCGAALGRGQCNNASTVCVCSPGWYGVDCMETHCSGTTVVSGSYGFLSDHGFGSTYAYNSNCVFEIQANGAGVALTFSSLSLGRGATLSITDSVSVLHTYGPFIYVTPEPVVVRATSSVRVVFTSDQSIPLAGWKLDWAAQSLCPASCSNSGTCSIIEGNAVCLCDAYSSGANCSSVRPSTELVRGVQANATVDGHSWTLFNYRFTGSLPELVAIKVARHSTKGLPFFYVGQGYIPTSDQYEAALSAADITNGYTVMQLRASSGVVYLNVHNRNADAAVTGVTIDYGCSADCPPENCVDGTCVGPVENLLLETSAAGGIIAVVVVLLIIGAFLCCGVLYAYRRLSKNNAKEAFERRQQLERDNAEADAEASVSTTEPESNSS